MENQIVHQIHQSPFKLVFISSGGGSVALSDLLKVPGASHSILESFIPYSTRSIDEYLKQAPGQYCSLATSLKMSMTAYKRAKHLSTKGDHKNLLGVAVTASLSTNYKKKGPCRFFLCIQSAYSSHVLSCYFNHKMSSRLEQENFISECTQALVAKACGLEKELPLSQNKLEYKKIEAKSEWLKLEMNELKFVTSSDKTSTKLIFPGSFNSLHPGHLKMKEVAEKKTKLPLSFEISLSNADKNRLSFYEVDNVLKQFTHSQNWILTNAPTFFKKAKLFPKATFVIGFDTLVRIFDSKFYQDKNDMNLKLKAFIDFDIKFLVFGRKIDTKFKTLKDFSLPHEFKNRFSGVGEEEFREDISSSEIRKREKKLL